MRFYFAFLIPFAVSLSACGKKAPPNTPETPVQISEETKETTENTPEEKAQENPKEVQEKMGQACQKNKKECGKYADLIVKSEPTLALEYYNISCFHGASRSCRKMGELYSNQKELELAAAAYIRGCKQKDAVSCNEIGLLFLDRSAFNKHMKKIKPFKASINDLGLAYIGKSCNAGFPDSCHNMGYWYETGGKDYAEKGVNPAPNMAMAKAQYLKACDKKLWDSCYEAGRLINSSDGKSAAQEHFLTYCLKTKSDGQNTQGKVEICELAENFSNQLGDEAGAEKAQNQIKCLKSNGCR